MSKIHVLIVDDHPLMRDALRSAIEAEADMEVVGEAANGRVAVEQASALQPDVIVMDLFMPGMDGLEATAAICAALPQTLILVLTSSTEEPTVLAAIQAGAHGYLLKDARRPELLEAIRELNRAHTYLPSQVALKLIHSVRRPPTATAPSLGGSSHHEAPSESLTPREREVFRLLGQGHSNREIAQVLHVSEATVRVHVSRIVGKLGLENRGQAIAQAARQQQADSVGGRQIFSNRPR